MDHRDIYLNELAEPLTIPSYHVDRGAVADATVRRRWSLAIAPPGGTRSSGARRRRSRAEVRCIARHRSAGDSRALAA